MLVASDPIQIAERVITAITEIPIAKNSMVHFNVPNSHL